MDTKTMISCIVHATLEYGCGSVFGDLANAVMPYHTKPLKKAIKHVSASVLGSYLGGWCAEKIANDIDATMKDILEIKADCEKEAEVVVIKKEENDG